MEVVLDKQYPVASGVDAAWAILSDMNELATCMPGAQITEKVDDKNYKGSVRVKVGPAVAAFAGTIEVLTLDPASRTLKMMGKGADKAGSSASMELTARLLPAADGQCTLDGHAEVIVNGKFAQFGGRMMTSVSDMILAQFADVFSQKALARQGPAAGASGGATTAAPVVAKEFNALGLVWAMIRKFFAGLFGKK
ncbi:MAG: SRPBCC family protein [Hylemonella sp.]|nr:SRPBCC family protein [Hylemonella sp.]